MFKFIFNKIFGSHNEKELKRLAPFVEKINALEPEISALSDAELQKKTAEFKSFITDYLQKHKQENQDEKSLLKLEAQVLDIILPEVFAVCREAAKRVLNMRHFDMQLIGGVVLHEGKIAEMTTGEGKTLVATLPAYLNTLTGRGVHIVTVNDYLAQRDCGWMGQIYNYLGLKCSSIGHDFSAQYDPDYNDTSVSDQRIVHLRPITRQQAYNSDITYGTNNEFGFDYLRNNMVMRSQDLIQRELNYAIVDEVDSILIDEARTPLIISGPAEESTDKYYKINKIVPILKQGTRDEQSKEETGDYIVDEKASAVYLTEQGEAKAASLLGVKDLSSMETMELKHHVDQGIKAHSCLFKRDVHYVVKNGEVIIVDEFTGRLMPGRRWSDGLHQAVEAKEGVKIARENQTLATITFQNYFRMYNKLAGMTGTALTEEAEFMHIYKLEVVVVPTNKPLIRIAYPDVVYKTEKEKFNAIVEEIVSLHKTGRPVLVGTISIEKSELISKLLQKKKIPHNVLNAKFHENEAVIVAQAGRLGKVTIATNMAGRGTDILLGGNADFFAGELLLKKGINPELATKAQKDKALQSVCAEFQVEHEKVVQLQGLHIIGTERHESRRIDNQLRGRSGRQGDPGSSRFYLSLADDLMRIFASDRIVKFMNFVKWEEGMPITHPLINNSIETAQKRVEAHNFDIRKHLLEYDNVMNKQREIIYEQRQQILTQDNFKDYIFDLINETVDLAIEKYLPPKVHPADWDISGLEDWMRSKFSIPFKSPEKGDLKEIITSTLVSVYEDKARAFGPDLLAEFSRSICLHILDTQWKDNLHSVDTLREGIGLRAFGQKDPLVEYQHESYLLFSDMIQRIKEETLEFLLKIKNFEKNTYSDVFVRGMSLHPETKNFPANTTPILPEQNYQQPQQQQSKIPYSREGEKVGRNAPCPCGSGKKYKKCCGK